MTLHWGRASDFTAHLSVFFWWVSDGAMGATASSVASKGSLIPLSDGFGGSLLFGSGALLSFIVRCTRLVFYTGLHLWHLTGPLRTDPSTRLLTDCLLDRERGAESFDGTLPFRLASRATCFFVTFVLDDSGEYVDRLAVGQTRYRLDIRGSAAGRGI